jgi:hypothetical protein
LQENRKNTIELQISVKQDNTTRTRTPKPGYLNFSIGVSPVRKYANYRTLGPDHWLLFRVGKQAMTTSSEQASVDFDFKLLFKT